MTSLSLSSLKYPCHAVGVSGEHLPALALYLQAFNSAMDQEGYPWATGSIWDQSPRIKTLSGLYFNQVPAWFPISGFPSHSLSSVDLWTWQLCLEAPASGSWLSLKDFALDLFYQVSFICMSSVIYLFIFKIFIYLSIYLFIFGSVGSSLLCTGFL